MVVVKTAKSRRSWNVFGAPDETNELNQGHLQGQEGIDFSSLSSSKRSLKRCSIIAVRCSGL